MNKKSLKIKLLFLFLFFGIFSAKIVLANTSFYVDSSYDLNQREELTADLVDTTESLYFYIDQEWWYDLSSSKKDKVKESLKDLNQEFNNTIYPVLTSEYGSEWKPGIDDDTRITVLFHSMKGDSRGYFNNGDEYSKFQNPRSNEREMIYLNADYITDSKIKSFLAHEFVHLITFNQKERLRDVKEEVWLNEGRAEYAPTLCGYNDEYERSYLKGRVRDFLNDPSNSITEWEGKSADYGTLSLFMHYLVDHYGKNILTESIKSSKIGIESINETLRNNSFKKNFSDIFTDWTITVFVNNCSLDENYCYIRDDLKNLKILPQNNFLPVHATYSNLSVYRTTGIWAGNWQKIFGGKGTLTFNFDGEDAGQFKVPYIICSNEEKCTVDFLELNDKQEGEIVIKEFNKKYLSLVVIPSVQDIDLLKKELSFSWNVEATVNDGQQQGEEEEEEMEEEQISERQKILQALLRKIRELLNVIGDLKRRVNASGEKSACRIENNLYYGLHDNSQVRCLQSFLASQGFSVYPQGLVTGNFLSLTREAVARFQKKYSEEILDPLDLEQGTGYVGLKTREKINELMAL